MKDFRPDLEANASKGDALSMVKVISEDKDVDKIDVPIHETNTDTLPDIFTSDSKMEGRAESKSVPIPDNGVSNFKVGHSKRELSINIITSRIEHQSCNFWIGVTTDGKIAPTSLLHEESTDKIFEDVTECGIQGGGPLMLTDTSWQPPRYVYFTTIPKSDLNVISTWIFKINEIIASWEVDSIGIYLAPEHFGEINSLKLLQKLTEKIALNKNINHIYFLVGKHGLSHILNTAHRIKSTLIDLGHIVTVFH